MKSILFAVVAGLAAVSGAVVAADAAAPAKSGGMRAACKADVQKFCAGTQRGDGRIVACLQQNHDQLSADCQGALAKAHSKRAPATPVAPKS
jgi:hypothetical protein